MTKSEGVCTACGHRGYVNRVGYCASCFKLEPPVERKKLWRAVHAAYDREYRKRPGAREKKRALDRVYSRKRYARMKAEGYYE